METRLEPTDANNAAGVTDGVNHAAGVTDGGNHAAGVTDGVRMLGNE